MLVWENRNRKSIKETDVDVIKVVVVGSGYWGTNLVRNFNALGALAAKDITERWYTTDLHWVFGKLESLKCHTIFLTPCLVMF